MTRARWPRWPRSMSTASSRMSPSAHEPLWMGPAQVRLPAADEQNVRTRPGQKRSSLDASLEARTDQLLELVAAVLAERDGRCTAHASRVARFARCIGAELGITGAELAAVERGALIHELGDRSVAALSSPTRPDLCDVVRQPLRAAELLEGLSFLSGVREIVREQRERYDGGGYPSGLRGDQICVGARVLAVAHAWDEVSAAEIERAAGQRFDPQVVAAWLRVPVQDWQRIRTELPGAPPEPAGAPPEPADSPPGPPPTPARRAAIARIRLRPG